MNFLPPVEQAQLDLFAHVAAAYARAPGGEMSNASMYSAVARAARIPASELDRKEDLGATTRGSPLKRRLRWYQQTLRKCGVLEHVAGLRGTWRLSESFRRDLTPVAPRMTMVAFSTDLGVALWGDCVDVFSHDLGEPIHLFLASPPYPLRQPRAYGNPRTSEYVDFICRALEGIVRNLAPGGSIVINVSNDIFEPGSPARSDYCERLVIALKDRLGLYRMDTFIWNNPSKAPGPLQWASKKRVQLNVGYEPIYWFSREPTLVQADNRRILQPHTERHKRLIASGGEQRVARFGDGAYRLKRGSFGNVTDGRIPRNVLTFGHACATRRATTQAARAAGLPIHGAGFPLRLVKFLVEYLTAPGQLVVDGFGGWATTGLAAEETGRRWLVTEKMGAYLAGAKTPFVNKPGFWLNPIFA